MNKYIIVLLLLALISCRKNNGEGRIRVFLEDRNGVLITKGEVFITYRTKKLSPKKGYSDSEQITQYKAVFNNLKKGWYTITFEGDSNTDKARVNLRLIYEAERTIWLRSGDYYHLPN